LVGTGKKIYQTKNILNFGVSLMNFPKYLKFGGILPEKPKFGPISVKFWFLHFVQDLTGIFQNSQI
jgi:hypothetical protein